jgi:hypothetical protein
VAERRGVRAQQRDHAVLTARQPPPRQGRAIETRKRRAQRAFFGLRSTIGDEDAVAALVEHSGAIPFLGAMHAPQLDASTAACSTASSTTTF